MPKKDLRETIVKNPPKTFTAKELLIIAYDVMNLGMQCRQNQLSGHESRSGNEILYTYLDDLFKNENII